jgi:magnesium chelatase subunit H
MPRRTSAADTVAAATLALPGAAVARASRARPVEAESAPMRVVLVTMDSHLASAARRAARSLARQLPGLVFTTHAADEWGSDERALERCKADILQGDIVIVTMLFLEDHFQPLLPVLRRRVATTATRWSVR